MRRTNSDEKTLREHGLNAPGMRVLEPRHAAPRVPAGTIRVLTRDNLGLSAPKTCLPEIPASVPNAQDLWAAQHLNRVIASVARAAESGEMVSNDAILTLRRAFRGAFGCLPEIVVWRDLLVEQLEVARIEWFAEQAGGAEPRAERSKELAEAALQRTCDHVGQRAILSPVPPRWLSANLTALLLRRFSFGRGGGTQRALSKQRIRDLLSDPRELARYLREDPERRGFFPRELRELAHSNRRSGRAGSASKRRRRRDGDIR
jgi:hypothetical protein